MATVLHDEEWRQLHQRLHGIAKRQAALDAEEAQCLREAHDMKLWQRFGYVHMNEYLELELGYGPKASIERVRIARALAELPQIEASLSAGHLSYSAVRELTRVATAETEQAWLDRVRGKNLRQIEELVSGKKRGDRPEDPRDPDLRTRVVRLELAPAVFALFRQVQSAMADEHGGHLDDSALMEILCRRALEGDGNADRPSHQIAITVCESCGRGWQNGAGREIEVGPEVVDRARCDAEMIGSLSAEQPERVTATVTPRIRRQVLARDHYRCTVPGCRSARSLDLHHIEFQRDGGSHEMWNLTVLCSGHHQALHDGILTISGTAPHALEFAWRASPGERGTIAHNNAPQRQDDMQEMHESPRTHVLEKREPTAARIIPARSDLPQRPDHVSPRAIDHDARAALITAGYKPREARAAVERARPHVGADASLEQVIREALRRCATPAAGSSLTVVTHVR